MITRPLVLINGKVITPIRKIENGCIVIQDGFIKSVGIDAGSLPADAEIVDLKGAYVSPGFIDLHIHGAWGQDVMAASSNSLREMSRCLVSGGVTSFLPTTLSGSLSQITAAVEAVSQAIRQRTKGAQILGVHLEGPYFSLQQKGAQNVQYIINPRPEDYLPLLDRFPEIIRVSVAPELPGAYDFGRELELRKIVASIAHSDATLREVELAIESGYTHVTHIYSGMSSLRRMEAYRIPGVLEAALLFDELTTEMIADGHHLPPSLMRLVLKTKGLEKVCLVTDSMAAAGLGPGKYKMGGLDVVVEANISPLFEIPTQPRNYVAKLLDRSSFAASVATMDQLVRNMVKLVGLSIGDAVKLATLNPAKMQNLEDRGLIAEGKKADLTVFDDQINILKTYVDGELVYDKP